MKKGPSFVPIPKHVDWLSIRIGLDKFVSKLRYRYIRSQIEEEEDSNSELSQASLNLECSEKRPPWLISKKT